MGATFIDATLTTLGLKRSIKKSVWEAPTFGVASGFSARSLLGTAGSGEVDPVASEAAAHQRDRHYGESGGEEIGSFRRQGGVSGLGMSVGKV
jgi:hypothetical protein